METERLEIKISKLLKKRLQKVAKQERRSMANMIRIAIEQFLNDLKALRKE